MCITRNWISRYERGSPMSNSRRMHTYTYGHTNKHTYGCASVCERVRACTDTRAYKRVHAQSILFDLLAGKSVGNGAHMWRKDITYRYLSSYNDPLGHYLTGQCLRREPLYSIARENVPSQRTHTFDVSHVCVNNVRQASCCDIYSIYRQSINWKAINEVCSIWWACKLCAK